MLLGVVFGPNHFPVALPNLGTENQSHTKLASLLRNYFSTGLIAFLSLVERDIQNFAPRAYAQSVPEMLSDQHRLLLASLEAFLSGRVAPALLVLGCGGEVLPYSFQYRDGALIGSNIDR